MIYAVTLFWRSAGKGWTEQYYRESGSARQATDLGGPVGLVPFLALRSPPVELQAVRAEEQGGLGRVYVREVHRPATTRDVTPDTSAVSVRCYLPFDGGSGRHVWIRGVPDQWVNRDLGGIDRPAGQLRERLERLWRRVGELELRGRRLQQAPWFTFLHSAGRHPSEPAWTRTIVDTPPALAVGQRVYFGGAAGCCPIQAERAYWVTEVTDAWLSLLLTWPAELADVSLRRARMRVLTYEYPLLQPGEFREFSAHVTRAAYKPATWTYTGQRSPVHPCGRVVDYLRQTYTTTIRPFRDDPGIALPVAWYWCKPGVGEVPYDHPFGSRQWQLQDGQEPLIGEQFARRRTDGGDVTGLDGVGVCGSAEQWAWGASVGDPLRVGNPETGQPCCCGPGVRVLAGGGAGGGEMDAGLPDGLTLHLRPEEVAAQGYQVNQPVTLWPAAPGTTVQAQGQGGHAPVWGPGVQFELLTVQTMTPKRMVLSNTAGPPNGFVAVGDYTIYVAALPLTEEGLPQARYLNLFGSPGNTDVAGYLRTGAWTLASSPGLTIPQQLPNGQSFVLNYRRTGGLIEVYRGDVLIGSATGTGGGTLSVTVIQGTPYLITTEIHPGVQAYEIMAWPRALDADERARVMAYLAARYAGILF